MIDPVRMCDDDGLVSDEPVEPGSPGTVFQSDLTYRKLLNNLRAVTGLPPYTGEPFACTGSVHLAGEHIVCASPAHAVVACLRCGPVYPAAGQTRGLCDHCRPILAATATASHPPVARALGIPAGPSPAVLPQPTCGHGRTQSHQMLNRFGSYTGSDCPGPSPAVLPEPREQCGDPNPGTRKHYRCTEPSGHDGDHITRTPGCPSIFARWPVSGVAGNPEGSAE